MSVPSGLALDESWGLHQRVATAFTRPLEELRGTLQQVQLPRELTTAAEPPRFQRACMLGLAAVTDLALDTGLSEPIRQALRSLPEHYSELLSVLQPASQAIMAASPDLQNVQHVEGMASLLWQATQAANPSTPVGVAAIGGATLGTLLFPGIGTAIGGALGVLLGGSHANKRDRRALERFAAAVKLMWAATEDLHNNLWNQLAHSVQKAGHSLPDAAYFETADARWVSIKSVATAVCKPGEPAPFAPAVEAFLRDWGPHPEALTIAACVCLPPYRLDLPALSAHAARLVKLYPNDPNTDEISARLALEQGQFAPALDAANRGLTTAPKNARLLQVQVESLAALGRLTQAEQAIRLSRSADLGPPPELALIGGLLRGGRRAEAAERARAWLHRDGKPALVAQFLRAVPITAALLTDGSIPSTDLTGILSGQAGRLQALVQRHLPADRANSYYGEPPGEKGRNAREEFLELQADESVLYFYDWSLWHNAKTGLAVTTRRLMWKCAFEDTVSLELSAAASSEVSVKGSTLYVVGRSIDVDNAPLAQALAVLLHEAASDSASGEDRMPNR